VKINTTNARVVIATPPTRVMRIASGLYMADHIQQEADLFALLLFPTTALTTTSSSLIYLDLFLSTRFIHPYLPV
jgi:hypothetical protein